MADLLGHEGLTRRAARAAALQAAKERAALGVDRAARGSARTCPPGFVQMALAAVKRFAAANPGTFSVEQMRTVLEEELPPVLEKRVWGKVAVDAIKAGFIERVPKVFMAGNEGRRGIVERAADFEDWNLGNGSLLGLEPHCWVLRPPQPLREVQRLHGGQTIVSFCMEPTIYPDAWLRPIRDEDSIAMVDSLQQERTAA